MAQTAVSRHTQPRSSTDTEERHLLAESLLASAATSIRTSTDADGERTPRATEPVRASQQTASTSQQLPYRGFASEQEYLSALRAWADGKRYETVTEVPLVGFYGTTTMEEYASRPAAFQGLGLKKRWRARKSNKRTADNTGRGQDGTATT